MNYRDVYRALSVKDALNTLMEIQILNSVDVPCYFETLTKNLNIDKHKLRKITNRLSRCKLIKSVRKPFSPDGRKRVFVITDRDVVDMIRETTRLML